MTKSVLIKGLGMVSGLGSGVPEHLSAIRGGRLPFLPLSELLGEESPWAHLPASWIKPRTLLARRKYGPATNLSVILAKAAIADAGWREEECREAAVFVGSSRGNAAGWLDPWPGRRPVKLMTASNSLHSEMAAAVTIELGIQGPYHVLANGCSAGLDALGFASLFLKSGMVKRALAIGVDLPLSPTLLDTYLRTGMLSANGVNDPYGAGASGLLPGEGGAALALEAGDAGVSQQSVPEIIGYWANSDAASPLGMPKDGAPLARLYREAILETSPWDYQEAPLICPHASGTSNNASAEVCALRSAWEGASRRPSFHMLKPYVGHTIGASGALETALLCAYVREGMFPAADDRFTRPELTFDFSESPARNRVLFKSASSMGGHNSLLALRV